MRGSSSRHIKLSVIHAYAPTNEADEEDKERFYGELTDVVEKVHRHDMLIITGDMNSKVGNTPEPYEGIMGRHGVGVRNDIGERLCDFCAMNNLVITGTLFPHKDIHKTTWVSPDGNTRNQIDHILVNRKFRTSIRDTRVYRGADIASDHMLVKTSVEVIHQNSKGLNKRKISQTASDLIDQRKNIKLKMDGARSERLKQQQRDDYREKDKNVKKQIKKDKKEWMENIAKEAEDAARYQNMRALYGLTKVLSNERPKQDAAIKSGVDNRLRKEQAGYRPGRGTTDQVFILRNIIEQSHEWQSSLYLNFIDFEKAFESVHTDSLWIIMKAYGIPLKIVELVKALYNNFECAVIEESELTEWFKIETGVKQGCNLSGFLFLLVIDWIMRKTVRNGENGIRWKFTTKLDDLDYADDIALISSTKQHL